MKKSFNLCMLVILVCLTQYSLFGQAKQNQFLVGGHYTLNYTSNKSTSNFAGGSLERGKLRNFQIAPQVGYFIFGNTALGLELLYHFNKDFGQSYQGHSNYSFDRSLSVIPFLRYYIGPGMIKPYLHTGIGPGWVKSGSKNYQFPESSQNSKLLSYEFRVGLGMFFNEYISFDLGLGYVFSREYFIDHMEIGPPSKWNITTRGINTRFGIVICI